jgi:hypothetical protein
LTGFLGVGYRAVIFLTGMLEDCRKNLADKADWFNFRVIDAQNIPFKHELLI